MREGNLTAKQVELFTRRLQRFLERNLETIIERADLKKFDALAAAQALGGLEQSLESLGLDEVLGGIEELYDDRLESLSDRLSRFSGKEEVINDVDVDITKELILLDTSTVKQRVITSVRDLRAEVTRAVLSGRSNVVELVRNENDELRARIDTELNTALSGFQGGLTKRKAEEFGFELFLYAGDIINTSREFCIERVGKVFTREEIDKMDNGQGLDVWLYKGGYNCRHDLVPVSKKYAEEELGADV